MHPAERAVQLPMKNSASKYGLARPADPMQTPQAVGQYNRRAPIGWCHLINR